MCSCSACRADRAVRAARDSIAMVDAALADLALAISDLKVVIPDHDENRS